MTTVISVYEANNTTDAPPPVADAATQQTLRAVDPAAPFGWIQISEHETAQAADAAVRTSSGLSGSYEAFHCGEVAGPPYDPADAAPVMFVNCFRFAPEQFDAAFARWRRVNDYMVAKPGYRWHKLHRRQHDDAAFGFVNVVEWESMTAWHAAHDAGFQAVLGTDPLPFTSMPTLCLPIG